jgi:hypothetical protein
MEAAIAEVFTRSGDRRTMRRLLSSVAHAAPVDHLTCRFPGSRRPAPAAAVAGFVRSPIGVTFVTNPLREGIRPDPLQLASWGLSVGDLEVF